MEDKKTTKRNLWLYPMGTVGRDAVYCLVNSYLLTYVLFTHSLNTAQLAAITGIMIAARIFDALNDPIMGNIIERTKSRFGKFKPWLVAGGLSTAVVVDLLFHSSLQGWSFIWFFGILYFAFSITFTMSDISYWGMIPALSSEADTRNRFTSRATLFAGIGSTLASILIPMYTTGSMAIGGSTQSAYGIIALVIAIACPAFLAITVFGVKEHREDVTKKEVSKFSLKKVFTSILRNDQLIWAAVVLLIQQIGNGIVTGGIGSTYIYFNFGYSGSLYSLFTTVGMSATAVLMVFYPTISRHITRKKLMGLMAVIGSIGYAMILLAGLLIAGNGMPKFWIIVIGYMLANFGQYCYYLILMISIMNTVEYNELKFGTRDEAIVTSLRPFITKLASALVVAITSISYIALGVTNYTNQISDLEQQTTQGLLSETDKLAQIDVVLSQTTATQSTGLLVCMCVIPWILFLISYVIYLKKYDLDEKRYDEICKELEERKK